MLVFLGWCFQKYREFYIYFLRDLHNLWPIVTHLYSVKIEESFLIWICPRCELSSVWVVHSHVTNRTEDADNIWISGGLGAYPWALCKWMQLLGVAHHYHNAAGFIDLCWPLTIKMYWMVPLAIKWVYGLIDNVAVPLRGFTAMLGESKLTGHYVISWWN